MVSEKKKKQTKMVWFIAGAMALAIVAVSVMVIQILLSDDSQKKKRQIQTVTLMKPPPPPKIKEKPPEPKVEKKEEIIEPEKKEPEPEPAEDSAKDEPPPGEELGLDADGTGGADGFGLRAKKGARGLIGGEYGTGALMRKYAWYTQMLQEELRKKMNDHLEKNGGIPGGRHKAVIRIRLDDNGNVLDFSLLGPSENQAVDKALHAVLSSARISEPPPVGMPKTIKLKVTSRG